MLADTGPAEQFTTALKCRVGGAGDFPNRAREIGPNSASRYDLFEAKLLGLAFQSFINDAPPAVRRAGKAYA